MTEERPVLDVVAIDVRELAFGSGIPARIDAMILIEPHWKQRSSQAPIYERGMKDFGPSCFHSASTGV